MRVAKYIMMTVVLLGLCGLSGRSAFADCVQTGEVTVQVSFDSGLGFQNYYYYHKPYYYCDYRPQFYYYRPYQHPRFYHRRYYSYPHYYSPSQTYRYYYYRGW